MMSDCIQSCLVAERSSNEVHIEILGLDHFDQIVLSFVAFLLCNSLKGKEARERDLVEDLVD